LEKDPINGIAEQLKLLKKDFYNYCFWWFLIIGVFKKNETKWKIVAMIF
jgi:hypothetical protein